MAQPTAVGPSIHQLAKEGRLLEISKLVKKDKKLVNKKDAYDQTPLHIAAAEGHHDVVAFLIDKAKADVNCRDRNNWTPLHAAANAGHMKLCEMLLRREADSKARTNDEAVALHYFVRTNCEDPVVCSLFKRVRFVPYGHANMFIVSSGAARVY